MKLIKNALVSVALATFVLAQPAAAETRSYESLPYSGIQHSVTVDRAGSPVADADQLHGRRCDRETAGDATGHRIRCGGGPILGVLLIFGALLALFAVAGLFGNGKDSTG
ncbi:MAG: hypothetical protein ABIP41_09470 [Croceibacterium sp.]